MRGLMSISVQRSQTGNKIMGGRESISISQASWNLQLTSNCWATGTMAFVGNEQALLLSWHQFFTNSYLWFSHNVLPADLFLNWKRTYLKWCSLLPQVISLCKSWVRFCESLSFYSRSINSSTNQIEQTQCRAEQQDLEDAVGTQGLLKMPRSLGIVCFPERSWSL